MAGRGWLTAAGALSLAAALLHLLTIVGGPAWYRFMGAGERMARQAEAHRAWPALVTLFIAAVLGTWAAYAFSGAGLLRPLPLLRVALVAITCVYLARGAVLVFPAALRRPDLSPAFLFWSSAIVLAIGIVHAVGLARAWPHLNGD